MARCFVDVVEGLLARETGEPARAVEVLERAIEQNRALASNPVAEACRLYWTAHLVLALAAVGRRDEAREKLESRRLWLHAAEEDDLLARCERAVAYIHPAQRRNEPLRLRREAERTGVPDPPRCDVLPRISPWNPCFCFLRAVVPIGHVLAFQRHARM